MPVEKTLPPAGDVPEYTSDTDMPMVEVEITPDAEGDELSKEAIPFDANLVDVVDEGVVVELGPRLVGLFEADDKSRDDWKSAYIKGLDLLGFKTTDRTTPWAGACGVWHPVMTEAVVRFQAQAIMEIFPSSGPVKTKIIGKFTEEKEKQAKRVQEELNYFICDKMTEYRPETETLLFYLALAGSAFRKIYYDSTLGRPVGTFIPAEDFVVPYGTTDLKTCPRYTQVMRLYANDIRKLQAAGFYADIELPSPNIHTSELRKKYDQLEGVKPSYDEWADQRYVLLEMHVDLDLPGFEDMKDGEPTGIELPYVVTVDKNSGKVLAIRRNWREEDPLKSRRQHYVPYHYLPGLGFYGSGLIHLIGGIASSATSILRQLVDSGTLSNLPGGLKSRGLRIKGDDTPIMPGEFRDVDVPMGSIKDNITFLPYKEPSAVLFELMKVMVEEGRKLGAAPDLPITGASQQAPVGTTLALLERSMKVMSAVQARLHASLKQDFKLISECIRDYMGESYEYEVEDQSASRAKDFSDRVDIIPVSDPNAASMAQRIVQHQEALNLAQMDPDGFDMVELRKGMLNVIGFPNVDKVVKDPSKLEPMDPVSENQALLNGKPTKAFLWQDHEAHITVHLGAIQDPKIAQMVGQSPKAAMIAAAAAAHITEHLAFQYRKEIEKQMGVELPPEGPLPPEVEVQLSKMVAEAAARLLKKDQAEAARQKAQQTEEDPVFQLQKAELEVKKQEVERKKVADQQKFAIDRGRLIAETQGKAQQQSSQERLQGTKMGVEIGRARDDNKRAERDSLIQAATDLADMEMRHQEFRLKMATEKIKAQATIAAARNKANGASKPA